MKVQKLFEKFQKARKSFEFNPTQETAIRANKAFNEYKQERDK